MGLNLVTSFDTPANFTFDAGDVEIAGSAANLLLQYLPQADFSEDFADDTDFTYNSSLAEFSGGQIQQKSQLPANAVVGVTYTSSINSSWNSIVPTPNGSPTLSAGKLVCTGSQGLSYLDASIGAVQNTGSIKVKYTPNYTTAPPANVNIFGLRPVSGSNDQITLTNSPSGNNLRISVKSSTGTTVYSAVTICPFSPTAGTTYEIELTWDTSTGVFRVFLDGVLAGTLTAGAYTRGTTATRLQVGASASVYNRAEGSFEDLVLFSNVQHTAGYTPGYTLPETVYSETIATLPTFTYSGPGLLRVASPPTSTESGTPRYIVQGRYWDGAAWSVSDGSYAQATSKADIVANVGSFPSTGASLIVVQTVFGASNTQSSVSQIDFSVIGEAYAETNPTIRPNGFTNVDGFIGFTADITETGADEVRFTIETRTTASSPSIYKYWDGAAWSVTDGTTYAETNTAAEMNTNALALDLSAGVFIRVVAYLHSDTGFTTPYIAETTLTYNFFEVEPEPRQVIVYGWLREIDDSPLTGTVTISNLSPFEHTGIFVPRSQISIDTDTDGYWETSVYETATISKTYLVEIAYDDTFGRNAKYTVTVPDQDSVNFTELIVL